MVTAVIILCVGLRKFYFHYGFPNFKRFSMNILIFIIKSYDHFEKQNKIINLEFFTVAV